MTPTVVSAPAEIPVVAVDPHTGPAGMPTVDADNVGGAIAATEHLLALGHRRIALLGGREDLESARLREHGFRPRWRLPASRSTHELVRVGGYRPETASAPARELLATDRPPDGRLRRQRHLRDPHDRGRPRARAARCRRTCRSSASTTCPSPCSAARA